MPSAIIAPLAPERPAATDTLPDSGLSLRGISDNRPEKLVLNRLNRVPGTISEVKTRVAIIGSNLRV